MFVGFGSIVSTLGGTGKQLGIGEESSSGFFWGVGNSAFVFREGSSDNILEFFFVNPGVQFRVGEGVIFSTGVVSALSGSLGFANS